MNVAIIQPLWVPTLTKLSNQKYIIWAKWVANLGSNTHTWSNCCKYVGKPFHGQFEHVLCAQTRQTHGQMPILIRTQICGHVVPDNILNSKFWSNVFQITWSNANAWSN